MTPSPEFFSGYLLYFIQRILSEAGPDESGLYNYYTYRIAQRTGLQEHEISAARYIAATFDTPAHRVIEAGIGIGTLSLYLAVLGYRTIGIEFDAKRLSLARRLRESALVVWPEVASRYTIAEGFFPDALAELEPMDKDTLLLFTNINATWPPGTTAAMIAEFARAGDVILDLRLFGQQRNLASERDALAQAILLGGAIGMIDIPAADDQFYRHFHFPRSRRHQGFLPRQPAAGSGHNTPVA